MKYKLKKKYPGSPKLGTEITPKVDVENTNTYNYYWGGSWFNPKDYPEFWELVIEKDYEILTVRPSKNHNTVSNKEVIYTWKMCDKNLYYWDIHSVKRLSDGEIFTIGDKCNPIGKYSNNRHSITKIWFCDPGYLRLSSDNYTLGINNIEKSKVPLFITEDGVDIFEGDKYYTVNEHYWTVLEPENFCRIDYETYHKNRHNFSTKEKAEKYILMNKPCLSINDVLDYFPKANKFLIRKDNK